ncbi:hypothetical protein EBU99_09120, partial [bacterium]|nr:hypothetical protein [bacterium]
MQYRNNRGSNYRPKPPRGPVKLTFGVIPSPNAGENSAPPPPPPRKAEEPIFARQEIVGTLKLKGVPYEKGEPLA